jgi:hypothetical protein
MELTVHDLFTHSTVSALANLIESKQGKTTEELSESTLDLMNEVDLHDKAIVRYCVIQHLNCFYNIVMYW